MTLPLPVHRFFQTESRKSECSASFRFCPSME